MSGSFRTSGPSGEAQISFAVEGRKAKGTIYVLATVGDHERKGGANRPSVQFHEMARDRHAETDASLTVRGNDSQTEASN